MEKAQTILVDLINNWNAEFPSNPLTIADFKKSETVMGAIVTVFRNLDIDVDTLLTSLPEEEYNEHAMYYRDLLPVVNMTRVVNHLVTLAPQVGAPVTMTHLLQPTVNTTYSVLLLTFHVMIFYKQRQEHISLSEEQLFAKRKEIKILEDKKNNLLGMLNEQAQEKGKRAERIEKMRNEIKQLEEELRLEKEEHEAEKIELEAAMKEERQAEMILEQKKAQMDAIRAEIAKRKALRVYDADDIRAQAEQAAQNAKETEEKLNSLQATLMQKENCLKNLQANKPNLDAAITLLHEIRKLSDSVKEYETGDLDSESKEGELDVLNTELSEIQAQLSELAVVREEAASKRQKNTAKRNQERMLAQKILRDAEENDRKCRERYQLALQRILELKEETVKFAAEKTAGMDELEKIKTGFAARLRAINEAVAQLTNKAMGRLEKNLRCRYDM